MTRICKLYNKIRHIGIIGTWKVILNKFQQYYSKNIISVLNKNHFLFEMGGYWNSYKRLERRYKNKILKMETHTGSGKSSNIIWWCWLQGEDNCPELQKRCLQSVRATYKNREIKIISNKNLYDYIELPDFIKDKYNSGYISHTHFSDLIRLQLLIKYGGTWIDSSTYCTGYDETLFDQTLFVFKNINYIWYANKKYCYGEVPLLADNWFITSEINNPILISVRDLLFDYWKHHKYLTDYFIFHFFFSMVVKYKYTTLYENIPTISHLLPHMLQSVCYSEIDEREYQNIIRQSTVHKLTNKVNLNELAQDCLYMKIINGNIK